MKFTARNFNNSFKAQVCWDCIKLDIKVKNDDVFLSELFLSCSPVDSICLTPSIPKYFYRHQLDPAVFHYFETCSVVWVCCCSLTTLALCLCFIIHPKWSIKRRQHSGDAFILQFEEPNTVSHSIWNTKNFVIRTICPSSHRPKGKTHTKLVETAARSTTKSNTLFCGWLIRCLISSFY